MQKQDSAPPGVITYYELSRIGCIISTQSQLLAATKGTIFMAKPFRVLVAEDDENDKLLLERAFFNAGSSLTVQFVSSGREAINCLQASPLVNAVEKPLPTLLLLDLNMPGVSGFEVLEWLRDHPLPTEVLPVVLTASDQQADVRRAHQLGAKCYLVKSQNSAEMAHMVERLEQCWENARVSLV
jgi:CheY-like chemotaxis protein